MPVFGACVILSDPASLLAVVLDLVQMYPCPSLRGRGCFSIHFPKMPYGQQHLLPSLHTQIKAFVSWKMQGRSVLVGFWTFLRNSSSIRVGEWKPMLLGSCITSIPTTAAHCASTGAERGSQRQVLADNHWPRHCLLGVQYLLQG